MKKFALFLVTAAPLAAFAHAHLERSQPAKGATVQASPTHVVLVFSESVGLTSLTLKKDGDKAARALTPLPASDGPEQAVPLPKLANGHYTVSFVAISTDQHETKGTFDFQVDVR